VHDITISKSKKREEMHLPQELVPKKKRKCDIGSKSKQVLNNQDALMLKLTWQEAQHFLHPSPTVNSNIMVIENHVFEEYEVSKQLLSLITCNFMIFIICWQIIMSSFYLHF
jgi:hypothetical protein